MTQSEDSIIRHIAHALWTEREIGCASVMVGAGFSRNARPNIKPSAPFPLWRDLADEMTKHLFDNQEGTRFDSLRIAGMYEATFGESELNRLLKKMIPDDKYEPDKIHKMLLDLPWADVFTTNYDRLLERTKSERTYSLVERAQDLVVGLRPRIVKLHGSFPSCTPYVITDEHFRKYPDDSAAFVNTVQQAMIETTFVLVGFSGDDPNFLQWAGWTRDNLGESAPKVFLCGIQDLTPPQRRLLEKLRVVPVDLGSKFPKDMYPDPSVRHARATEWLLLSLHMLRPKWWRDWPNPPKSEKVGESKGIEPLRTVQSFVNEIPKGADSAIVALQSLDDIDDRSVLSHLETYISYLRVIHQAYPGWVTCPSPHNAYAVRYLRVFTNRISLPRIVSALQKIDPITRIRHMSEIYWLFNLLGEVPSTSLLAVVESVLREVRPFPLHQLSEHTSLTPANGRSVNWTEIGDSWIYLVFSLISTACINLDQRLWSRWIDESERVVQDNEEWQARWFAERCNWALITLDVAALSACLKEWPSNERLPWWEARRAAFLAEFGSIEEANALTRRSLQRIGASQKYAGQFVQLLSMTGWMRLLANSTAPLEDYFEPKLLVEESKELAKLACDPYEEFVKITAKSVNMPEAFPEAAFTFLRILFTVPYPFNMRARQAIGMDVVKRCAQAIYPQAPRFSLMLLLRCGAIEEIAHLLSGLKATSLDSMSVDTIAKQITAAIASALDFQFGSSRGLPLASSGVLCEKLVRTGVSLLGHLCPRLGDEDLQGAFLLAIKLQKTPSVIHDSAMGRVLDGFWRSLLHSVSYRQLGEWIPDLLHLSTQNISTLPASRQTNLPNPFTHLELRDIRLIPPMEADKIDKEVVASLLHHLDGSDGILRQMSNQALATLHQLRLLDKPSEEKYSRALWSRLGPDGLPEKTQFYCWAFLTLPHPTDIDVQMAIRKYLCHSNHSSPIEFVNHLVGATGHFMDEASHLIHWTSDELRDLFFQIEKFVTNAVAAAHSFYPWSIYLPHLVQALALVIIPGLKDSDGSVLELTEKLLLKIEALNIRTSSALPSLLYVGRVSDVKVQEELIRDISSSDAIALAQASQAIIYWSRLSCTGRLGQPPHRLLHAVIGATFASRGNAQTWLLSAIVNVMEDRPGILDDDDILTLIFALNALIQNQRPKEYRVLPVATLSQNAARQDESMETFFQVSRLARTLSLEAERRSLNEHEITLKWKEICSSWAAPEVRRLWESDRPICPMQSPSGS